MASSEKVPMSSVQSSSCIHEKQNSGDIPTYLEIFRDESDELLSEECKDSRRCIDEMDMATPSTSNAVFVTWTVMFDKIKAKNPEVARLLALMSLYDRQGMLKVAFIRGKHKRYCILDEYWKSDWLLTDIR